MSFTVAEDCVKLGLRAAAVVFRNVHVGAPSPALRSEISGEIEAVRGRFRSAEEVRAVVASAGFAEVLRKVGVNPRREQPSVERLLNFALKRGDLPRINSLVDAYNLVSVRSLCSLGAHDLDRFTAPATLRLLTGRESFTPLGADTPQAVTPGEFGYVDADNRVLCRLDLLQADFSKVTEATHNALLIVEGTTVHRPDVLRRAVDAAVEVVTRHCGGTAEVVAFPYP
jgi:DNA/RNA-binding domain of Phe-tRNA-synthetase-like protein